MSSLKPLADRVLVKPDEAEQKTASGLYIASNAQEQPQRGTIVAVGAGKVAARNIFELLFFVFAHGH